MDADAGVGGLGGPGDSRGGSASSSGRPEQAPRHFEHLQWLCSKDQQVLCRAEAANAVREEQKLTASLRATIESHMRAVEHCKAASDADPEWFTLDAQDCHNRRVHLLLDILRALEQDQVPVQEDAALVDGVRGKIYASYAHSAQVTERFAKGLLQGGVDGATVRSAFGALSTRLRTFSSDALGAPSADSSAAAAASAGYVPPTVPLAGSGGSAEAAASSAPGSSPAGPQAAVAPAPAAAPAAAPPGESPGASGAGPPPARIAEAH